VIPTGRDSYFTQGTQSETLCRNPLNSGRASALEQTRAEKPYRTPKDSSRASAFELRGGFLKGREALQPSEPRHSPDKATPSYYTKNRSFASGISKMWCVLISTGRVVFIGPWGELHRLGQGGNLPSGGRPTKPRGRPAGWRGFH
jgi:hypothetical protein